MGVIVNLIEEIKSRFTTAIGTGGDLLGVKRIRIGSREEARKQNDFPIINITLTGATNNAEAMQRQFTDTLNIEITLLISKKDSNANTLYTTTDSTGSIYVLEKMLNVLNKNTSGTIDLQFASNTIELREIDYSIEEANKDMIEIIVNLKIKTAYYTIGGM